LPSVPRPSEYLRACHPRLNRAGKQAGHLAVLFASCGENGQRSTGHGGPRTTDPSMTIKFNCPHCHKGLSVKEHLAGKRAPCPSCKKVLTIPAPVAMAADVEDLAAAAFADEPKAGQLAKEIKFVEFEGPQCLERIKMNVELDGK